MLFFLQKKEYCHIFVFFFFQAEDGIRDRNVTGDQTCALPISRSTASRSPAASSTSGSSCSTTRAGCSSAAAARISTSRSSSRIWRRGCGPTRSRSRRRSEERRVGKERRGGGWRGSGTEGRRVG